MYDMTNINIFIMLLFAALTTSFFYVYITLVYKIFVVISDTLLVRYVMFDVGTNDIIP